MPKFPRVSGRDTIRALEKLGFVQQRQRGSHVVLRRGTKGCVVPVHKELKTGTLIGILRQAEVTADEFIESL
ncbi:MAG: type II toxin-antitoxin system HicA family toxin [Gammaproteobacteria bacterium]|nr:type II toxin-antitoxin system HicA family toxin [Gammaproteobacteria bacterium]